MNKAEVRDKAREILSDAEDVLDGNPDALDSALVEKSPDKQIEFVLAMVYISHNRLVELEKRIQKLK